MTDTSIKQMTPVHTMHTNTMAYHNFVRVHDSVQAVSNSHHSLFTEFHPYDILNDGIRPKFKKDTNILTK